MSIRSEARFFWFESCFARLPLPACLVQASRQKTRFRRLLFKQGPSLLALSLPPSSEPRCLASAAAGSDRGSFQIEKRRTIGRETSESEKTREWEEENEKMSGLVFF